MVVYWEVERFNTKVERRKLEKQMLDRTIKNLLLFSRTQWNIS